MRAKILLAALAVSGILAGCNRVDEDLLPVGVVADAPVLSGAVVTVEEKVVECASFLRVKLAIVTISVDVNWLAEGECFQGAEPGTPCRNDSDCDDLGNERGICGQTADRLVLASAIKDPVDLSEVGLSLFDNGEELVEVFDSNGNTLPGSPMVTTGDLVAEDGRYTRRFVLQNAGTALGGTMNDCIFQDPELETSFIKFAIPTTWVFRIDVVDGITGSAKLSILTEDQIAGNGFFVATTECCLDFGTGFVPFDCTTAEELEGECTLTP